MHQLPCVNLTLGTAPAQGKWKIRVVPQHVLDLTAAPCITKTTGFILQATPSLAAKAKVCRALATCSLCPAPGRTTAFTPCPTTAPPEPAPPVGFVMTREELQRAADATAAAGSWLVIDNTYEHFTYDGAQHCCVSGRHVINIFSFSKAYGMMGWRVGYLAYPDAAAHEDLGSELLKVQDTIPICPTQVSQLVALESLKEGRGWVTERVQQLEGALRSCHSCIDAFGWCVMQHVLRTGAVFRALEVVVRWGTCKPAAAGPL